MDEVLDRHIPETPFVRVSLIFFEYNISSSARDSFLLQFQIIRIQEIIGAAVEEELR